MNIKSFLHKRKYELLLIALLVYYCSITLTTIGYGDITPNAHYTKLAASLIGIAGQFYSVVLVGILISKFTSHSNSK